MRTSERILELTEHGTRVVGIRKLARVLGRDRDRRVGLRDRRRRSGSRSATIAILARAHRARPRVRAAVFDDPVTAFATAPAFGAAALTLTAVALDRLGLRLEWVPVALAASALAGLGGFALLFVMKRKRDRQAPA